MNEIPQSGPDREKYIISVMQGVKREGDKALNVQAMTRIGRGWFLASKPKWNWDYYDYRLYEPEVVHYANGYEDGVGSFRESIEECKRLLMGRRATHYVKRTTGGGRAIPEYDPLPLESDE